MNRKLRPPVRLPWALLACCAVMAAVVGLEWSQFAGATPAPEAAPPEAAAAAAAPLARYVPPPEDRFAEIAQRPLFVPERRPQQDVAPQKPIPAPNPPTLMVQGVVLTEGHHYAIIQHGNPPKLDDLSEGATVDGWQIESIDSDRIALRAGAAEIEFPVGKPATAAPARAQPRPVLRRGLND
jgi:general secretion pathway protein N